MDTIDQTIQNIKLLNEQKANKIEADTKHHDDAMGTLQTQEVIVRSFKSLVDYLDNHVSKTNVVNQLREIGTPDALKVVTAIDSLHETLKTHENTDLSEVTSIMKSVLDEAKKIPKELPKETKPVDHTSQFKSLEDTVKKVEEAVKAQELRVEAPVVNVPETVVNVEAPNLKPLTKGLEDIKKAVKNIIIPEAKETDTKQIESELKKANRRLKQLVEKPVGGSGGGGSSWTAVNTSGIPMPLNLDVDGNLKVSGGSGGGGDASAANQVTGNASLASIDTKLTDKSQFTKITDGTDTALVTASGEQNVLETNSAAIKTAVETIDNIVSGAGINQTQVGGTNIDTNSGVKSAGTQRVVLATDQPQLTNALKVDGSAVTQPVSIASVPSHAVTNAGTFAVQAAQSGTWNVGTVTTITNNVNTVEVAPTTIYNGKKTVTTAGTRVTLASSQAVKSVTIKALSTNTGIIYVGDTSVASTNGFQLSPGETLSLDIANLNTVNLDASVSGESVTYVGVN